LALAVLVALIAGWVASYRGYLNVSLGLPAERRLFVHSYIGRISLKCIDFTDYPPLPNAPIRRPWQVNLWQPKDAPIDSQRAKPFAFRLAATELERFFVAAPHWFLTTLAAMAAALSFKRTWRFTTRQLLIATTAVAAVLAAAVWSMRG
jgi:hypothetical protein